jgi:hypothetical protein
MEKQADISACIVLDTRTPWLVEFASALTRQVQVQAFSAAPQNFGWFSELLEEVVIDDPPLKAVQFPVQRGYFSFPLRHVLKEHHRIVQWLQRGVSDPGSMWLVCCYPHYSKVTALWPGPVVYYATDLFSHYEGRSYRNVTGMETDLCRQATLVCPNSRRIADYFARECSCEPAKILILPNAVRHSNLLPTPSVAPRDLPAECADLPRPVAGVIGNMGANVNWVLLEELAAGAPWLSWVFVGPTTARIGDTAQRQARARLLAAGGNLRFVGPKPYGELKAYARSVDCAVLPYMKREPTYSGSSTRFYEHLAACRPILATDGFAELLDKQPLLRILRTTAEWLGALHQLRDQGFRDGFEESRWQQSQLETWDVRAQHLTDALRTRVKSWSTKAEWQCAAKPTVSVGTTGSQS